MLNLGTYQPGLNSVVVKYTYNGDSDLNGTVNAFDYFRIDQGYRLQGDPSYRNYRNGDVDYGGSISADDFYLIDAAFIHQGAPLALNAVASPPAIAAPTRQMAAKPVVAPFPPVPSLQQYEAVAVPIAAALQHDYFLSLFASIDGPTGRPDYQQPAGNGVSGARRRYAGAGAILSDDNWSGRPGKR